MTRIHVVASSPLVRAGLESMLREDPRFVVLPANAGAFSSDHPDVLLIELQDADGFSRRSVFLHGEAPPTVLLAEHLGRAQLRRALHSGVRAVLPRDAAGPEIIAAIQGALAGLFVLSSEDMDSLLPADAENSVADLIPGESLSTRELEVLAALAEGMGNKDIAARLRISEHTVKFHVRSIMGKFGAATRGEAVARGVREGLVVL